MAAHPDTSTRPCTRRRILGWGGAGAIGGFAGYLGWSGISAPSAKPTIAHTAPPKETLSAMPPPAGAAVGRESFLPHLKSKFRISSPALAATECLLTEVGAAHRSGSPVADFTGFSLIFTAAAGFTGESAIYQLSHPELGAMELFLSSVGRSEERVTLEAVFSQRA